MVVAKAQALLRAGQEPLPEVSERVAWIAPCAATEEEAWAVHQAYALMPHANFSRAGLESYPAALAVSELPPLTCPRRGGGQNAT